MKADTINDPPAPASTINIFLTATFPKTIDGLVAFINDLKASGRIETLADLRKELVNISKTYRKTVYSQ